MTGRTWRVGVVVAAAVAVAGLWAASLPAMGAQTPFAVRSASLRQQGRRLRFTVRLDHRISTTAMRRQRRSLCLLVVKRKTAVSQLCVKPPGQPHSGARLLFARIAASGPVKPRPIPARVTRPGPHVLSATFLPARIGLPYKPLHWQILSSIGPPGCLETDAPPGFRRASDRCTVYYPGRPRLTLMHTPRLVGCVPRGRSLVFSGPSNRHEIALTFDDGPWNDPPTIDFVSLLHRYHVPGTFFEIGDQISTYDPTGAIERRMLAYGDMIGVHTWTHPVMTALPPAGQRFQLQATANAIRDATGFTPCLWRPPYGATNTPLESLARSLGMLTIYWSIDPRDWSLPGVGAIESNVISNARNGAIALMHFGGGPRWQTLTALPHIITSLRARGYRFVTVAELLGLRMIYR